jgi:S1-C subfamily serine protease
VLTAGLVIAGVGIGHVTTSSNGMGSAAQGQSSTGSATSGANSLGSNGSGTSYGGAQDFGQGADAAQSGATATAAQQSGIVTIVSVLGYQNAESAGTGMVLTSDGEILTNNHVVNGATSITVTVESSGESYRAAVVGTDPTDDVAVLQLSNASGLTTANLGDSADLAVGDAVTGVGNAGGTGTLTAAPGTVTALDQSITATDESGSDPENLTGLIETDAGIAAGDSGGPLYDSAGEIVGMDTAASSSPGDQTASQAYAIPIDDALNIADQIESGVQTAA